ncbi:MAG: YfiR family protein [Cyclobacteriaceae bacterium]
MNKKLIILAMSFGLVISAFADMEQRKAGLIYYLLKNVEYPDTKSTTDSYIITVYGSDAMQQQLEKITANKKIANRSIVIKRANTIQEIKDSHIVYLADEYAKDFLKARYVANSYGAMLITESEGFGAKGAQINFVNFDGSVEFEINKTALKEVSVRLSARLMDMSS